jgi:hypothetical protein
MEVVKLPYLDSSSNTVQVNDGRLCEGCLRDGQRARTSDGAAWTRSQRAYLEDQFLEHFNKCETAWKIAAGQRMTVHDEWWLCQKLQLKLPQARDSNTAAVRDLRYGEELTPEAFKAEYERLDRILSEGRAQKMMEIESRERIGMLPE